MSDPHGERSGDYVDTTGRKRTREEDLEELLNKGSRNFRAYRRRAYVAFIGLAVANAVAIYVAVHNGTEARADLADAGAETAIRGCRADNALRLRLVAFVADLNPELEQRAAAAFPPRDCALEARGLQREARRGTP